MRLTYSHLQYVLRIMLVFLALEASAFGQITDVTNQTSTPIPGSGHDYFKMLSETTNPANGSVSIHIQLPVVPGRQLTLPVAIAYESTSVIFFQAVSNGPGGWGFDQRTFSQGGWQLTVPQISDVHTQRTSGQSGQYQCQYYTGYVFYDANDVRHPLGLAYVPQPNSNGCINQSRQVYSYLSGYDDFDEGSWANWDQTVSEPNGNTYSFSQLDWSWGTGILTPCRQRLRIGTETS